MRTFWFSGLLALAACTGGDINYNDTAGDGGGVEATGTFVGPQVEFFGGLEDCTSVLTNEDGKVYTANSGVSLELAVGTYTVTFGDKSLASTASGNLPIHTSPTGWTTITPAVTVEIEEGVEQLLPPPVMNGYVDGTWTCNFVGGGEATAQTATVQYSNGKIISLPTGDLEVEGTLLYSPDVACAYLEGEFLSNTQLSILVECAPPESYESECWAGTYAQRPATW